MIADSQLTKLDIAVSILEQFPEALVVSDGKENAIWCNSAFEKIVGTSLSEMKDRPVTEVLQRTLSPVQNMKNIYSGMIDSNNSQQWYEQKTMALKSEALKSSETLSAQLLINISDRIQSQLESRKLQEKLDQLTTIEPISGLLNNRAMLQSLEPLVSRSRRYDNPLSLIAINLLNLALLVDRHGQDIADEAVIALSHLLKDQLRWADIISRYDTSIILIILPETSHDDALFLANKIMAQVDELDIPDKNGTRMELDACYGISSWQKGDDSSLLIARVQKFLEVASKNGSHSIIDSD